MESACYRSPDKKHWQGRSDTPDGACIFQIIRMLDLLKKIPVKNEQPTFGLIGFCCDEGIRRNLGRIGAAEGPITIRQTLAKLPVPKQNIICYDAGDIICANRHLERAQEALGEAIAILLKHKITPIVLGGGHELAWGHYQGIANVFPQENLGIINFDAHFDMRPLLPGDQGTSGTPFLQIAQAHQDAHRRLDYNCIGIQNAGNISQIFNTAKAHQAHILYADDLYQEQSEKCIAFIHRIIEQNQILYLSLCLDVLAAAYAPGVSAPQPLGLTPWLIIPLLRQLAQSAKVISYDIAELSPTFDSDQRTAKLAAHFIFEILHHHRSPYQNEERDLVKPS